METGWTSDEVPFIGRPEELSLLNNALEMAKRGGVQVVVIEGEAGIGKSRLAVEASNKALALGYQVVKGQCDELEEHRPFAALAQALCGSSPEDSTRLEVAELIAAPRPGGLALEFQVIDLLTLVAERMLSRGPLLVLLEDVQWSDPGTIKAVRSMQRNLASYAMTLVLTARLIPRSEELSALLRSGAAHHVALGPLDESDSAALFEAITGRAANATELEKLRKAGGNPLFIRELLQALQMDDPDQGGTLSEITPDLRLTLLRKIGFLGAEVVSMLKMASLLGAAFSMSDLSAITEKSVTALLPSIETALAAGVFVEKEERLAFRHDLLREAIYEEIPRSTRGALHLHAARALSKSGARPEEVADHYLLGAQDNDPEAIEWLLTAADRVRPTAPAAAIHLYENAQRLMAPADQRCLEIITKMLPPLLAIARVDEAEELAREALLRPLRPMTEVEIRGTLADILEYTGRTQESCEQHVLKAKVSIPDEELTLLHQAEALRATPHLDEGIDELTLSAEESGNTRALGELMRARYARLLIHRSWPIDPSEVTALTETSDKQLSLALADLPPTTPQQVRTALRAYWFSCDASVRKGDFAQMIAFARRAKNLAETYGFPALRSAFQGSVADALLLSGAWDDALAEAQTALEDVREYGEPSQEVYPRGIIAFISAHRGEIETARTLTRDEPERRGLFDGPWFDLARLAVADADNKPDDALGILRRSQAMWSGVERTWRLIAAGDEPPSELLPFYARDCDHLYGRFLNALMERDVKALDEALKSWQGRSGPYYLARGLEMKAAFSEGPAAVADLEDAERLYEGLDAQFDIRRVASALRVHGITRGVRGKRGRRTTFGWGSVTTTELKVAELISTGLSNPEIAGALFISRRTVTTHISSIFRKLGMTSRTELAAEVARRGASDS